MSSMLGQNMAMDFGHPKVETPEDRGFWNTVFNTAGQFLFEDSPLAQAMDYWVYDPMRRAALRTRDPRNAELLSPNTLSQEFPRLKSKNPMMRAEAIMRDRELADKEEFASRPYTGTLPEWSAHLIGGIGGTAADASFWLSTAAGWGILTKTGVAAKVFRPGDLALKTWRGRGYGAAAAAITNFTGDLIYNVANYGTANLTNRPYEVSDIVERTAIATGLGGVLGAAFPGVLLADAARVHGAKEVNFWRLVAKAEDTHKKMGKGASGVFKDKFLNFLEDNTGSIEIRDIFSVLGKKSKIYQDFEDLVRSRKIKITRIDDELVDKARIDRVREDSSEYLLEKKLKENKSVKVRGWDETAAGQVAGVNGHTFDTPRTRYVSPVGDERGIADRVADKIKPIRHSTRQGVLYFPRLFLPIQERPIFDKATSGDHVHYAGNSQSLAGTLASYFNPLEQVVAEVETGQLSFADLDFFSLQMIGRPYVDLSLLEQAGLKQKLLAETRGGLDGFLHTPRGDEEGSIVEISEASMDKLGRFATARVRFNATRPGGETAEELLFDDAKFEVPRAVSEVDDIFSTPRVKGGVDTPNLYLEALSESSGSVEGSRILQAPAPGGGHYWLDYNGQVPEPIATAISKSGAVTRTIARQSIRKALDTIGHTGGEKAVKIRDALKSQGVVLPKVVEYNTFGDTWTLLDQHVIPPLPYGNRIFDQVWEGTDKVPGDVQIRMPIAKSDLNKHPSMQSALERLLSSRLIELTGAFPQLDTLAGRAYWNQDPWESLPSEIRNLAVKLEGGDVSVSEIVRVRDAIKEYTKPTKLDAEGNKVEDTVVLGEQARSMKALFDVTPSRVDYHVKLLQDIRPRLLGDEGEELFEEVRAEYVEAKAAAEAAEAGSPTAISAHKALKKVQTDIETISRQVTRILAGGLQGATPKYQYLRSEELIATLKDTREKPYLDSGGMNLEGDANALFNQLMVTAQSKMLKTVTPQELKFFQAGLYDDYITEIKYFVGRKLEATKDTSGGKVEDEFKPPIVPEAAWKIYRVLRHVMDVSQRLVTDAGHHRGVIENYIGTLAYDPKRIWDRGKASLAIEITQRTNQDAFFAERFFDNIVNTFTGGGRKEAAESFSSLSRKIKFKSAADEMAFLRKYGRGVDRGLRLGTLKMVGSPHAASYILNGAFSALEADAKLAAVTRNYGTRPMRALDIYFHVLRSKYLENLPPGFTDKDVAGGLVRAKKHAETMINDYLTPAPSILNGFAELSRNLKNVTTAMLLPLSGITAATTDMFSSTAMLAKYMPKGGSYEKNLAVRSIELLTKRLRLVPREKREKLARQLFVVTSADLQQMGLRYFRQDAPGGLSTWMLTGASKTWGLHLATDLARVSNARALMGDVANMLEAGREAIHPEAWERMRLYGMQESDWQVLQRLHDTGADIYGTSDGARFLAPEKLSEVLFDQYPSQVAQTVLGRIMSLNQEIAWAKGVPQSNVFRRSYLGLDPSEANTVGFALLDSMAMFKPIAAEFYGVFLDAGQPFRPNKRAQWDIERVRMTLAASALLMLWGMVNLQTKEIARGKTPRDMSDPKFYWDAMVRSGMLGLYGDLLAPFERSGSYPLTAVAPAYIPVEKGFLFGRDVAVEAWMAAFDGEEFDANKVLRSGLRAVESVTPGVYGGRPISPIILNTFFLERWNMLNYETYRQRRKRERWMEKRGQQYLGEVLFDN